MDVVFSESIKNLIPRRIPVFNRLGEEQEGTNRSCAKVERLL